MKAENLIKGARYWNIQYWRYMWYKGTEKHGHSFEDAAGVRFTLSDDSVKRTISEKSWR